MAQTFEIRNFPTLPIGTNFVVDSEAFTKTSELMYRDAIGIEHHIDHFFDIKLGRELDKAKAAQVGTQQPAASTIQQAMEDVFGAVLGEPSGSALGGLSDSDVERIAQRVAAILKKEKV